MSADAEKRNRAGGGQPGPSARPPQRDPGASGRPAGPRPLALHLQLAWLDSLLATAHHPHEGGDAGLAAARERFLRTLTGLARYWRQPRTPPAGKADARRGIVWQRGASRLIDHGPAGAPTALVLPSLVNRARVLDLLDGRSLLAHLAARDIRPLLLDWGEPGPEELGFSLADHVRKVAAPALRVAREIGGGRPPILVGHCMGGLLAAALAAQAGPGAIAGLACLATPWDFHAGSERLLRLIALLFSPLTLAIGAQGFAPVDLLQTLFALLDPPAVAAKFQGFATLAEDGAAARRFVAVEDWVHDGVALAGPAALEVLWHWYGANLPGRGLWRLGGVPVLPERLRVPSFLALPSEDRIVPPPSAEALAARLPHATVVRPSGGHVAMLVGGRAQAELYEPLAGWMRRLAASGDGLS